MKGCKYILLLFFCAVTTCLPAQEKAHDQKPDDGLPAMVYNVQVGKVAYKGDSIPHIILPTLRKYPPLILRSNRERNRYNRLVYNVKKLLPLAKIAKLTVIETYEFMETLPPEERAAHLARVEEGLKKQYGPVIKHLTRSQGRLFVKLIDRECNQTGYSIAKAFIGSFKANAYQALAFCFGQSLTRKYDPEGDDYFTERVVLMVESGQL